MTSGLIISVSMRKDNSRNMTPETRNSAIKKLANNDLRKTLDQFPPISWAREFDDITILLGSLEEKYKILSDIELEALMSEDSK